MALIVVDADDVASPDGYVSLPHVASLQVAASLAVTTPTTAQPLTDADGWAAGLQQPAQASGGPVVSETAGSVTITRAGNYKVRYGVSQITGVNSQVITLQIFGGSAGDTAKGGICKVSQPGTATAIPNLCGEAFFACALGDVVRLKVIADTGNFTCASGFLVVEEA